VETQLDTAMFVVRQEVARRGLSEDVGIHRVGPHICITLKQEGRAQWIGYESGQGYYLVGEPNDQPAAFFELTPATMVVLFPPPSDSTARVDDLLETLTSHTPDVRKVEAIIDATPVTERGLDVLGTIALIRARELAISKLAELSEDENAPESAFQQLFAAEPWMLGAQYSEVVARERMLWFGARADLLLASVLGYVDIVELKKPSTRILTPASRARTWKQSSDLADAYAQAQQYLRLVDENRLAIENELGIGVAGVSRMYRSSVVIVAGRQPAEEAAQDVIRELNNANPRVTLMTYDEVAAIAEATIRLFRRRLISEVALPSGAA
jgi:Domain of unknown function (DUF4263)